MTRQVSDRFTYNKQSYKLACLPAPYVVFEPNKYGLNPEMASTNCGRGYWCEYAIEDDMLILKQLHIHTKGEVYPDLNGAHAILPTPIDLNAKSIQVTTMDNIMHLAIYEPNMLVPYNSRLLLGRDFMSDKYEYMGFLSTWGYRELLELVFEKGFVKEVIDQSKVAVQIRELKKVINQSEAAAQIQELKEKHWWLLKYSV